jgi:iron-sulfur cluster repair protein YtfE (RIC family)
MTEHQRDVVAVLVHDHREVEDIFGKIEKLPAGDPRRKEYAEDVIIELVRHSVAEEQYLYPATRRLLEGGDGLADREIEEHAEAERTMKEIERRSVDDPEFDRLLAQLASEVRSHVEEEENELFPQLQHAASPEELQELGARVERAKKVAPTRPHPSAPDTPPANKVLGPGAGLVDRARDALTGRGSS